MSEPWGSAAPVARVAAVRLSTGRRLLVEQNLELVDAIVRHEGGRLGHRVAPDDLYQEGFLGLHHAAETFDAEIAHAAGRSFPDWAKPLIRWRMRRAHRTEHRHEKRVLRAAQESGAEQVLRTARQDHPYNDSESDVEHLLDDSADTANGSMLAMLVGAVLRAPGEDGIALRLQYARTIAAVTEERAKLEPYSAWVLARKYDDGMSWPQLAELAAGPTIAQLRGLHDKAILALGKALRKRGIDEAPPVEGRSDDLGQGP